MLKKIAWFLFFLITSVSCLEDPDCFALNNNLVQITFRRLLDGKADSIVFFRIDAVSAIDSVFDEEVSLTTSSVTLPLNFLQGRTTYILGQALTSDTLTLEYDSRAQFVSEDCGERYVLSDLRVGSHSFDSISVVNGSPVGRPGAGASNIIVYRCPILNHIKFAFRQLNADDISQGEPLDVMVNTIQDNYSTNYIVSGELSTIALPLNDADGSTKFDFHFPEGSNSITLAYNIRQETLVDACGVQNIIDPVSIVSDDFEFARVLKDSIKDPPVTNIVFFRCPDTDIIRIDFKQPAGNGGSEVILEKITADYTSEIFYSGATVTSVDLPLNPSSGTTGFVFDFGDSIKNIQFNYTTTQQTFHEECNQTLFSNIVVSLSDFDTGPAVVSDSIVFPTQTNIEIVTD